MVTGSLVAVAPLSRRVQSCPSPELSMVLQRLGSTTCPPETCARDLAAKPMPRSPAAGTRFPALARASASRAPSRPWPPKTRDVPEVANSRATVLPDGVRARMQATFGIDFMASWSTQPPPSRVRWATTRDRSPQPLLHARRGRVDDARWPSRDRDRTLLESVQQLVREEHAARSLGEWYPHGPRGRGAMARRFSWCGRHGPVVLTARPRTPNTLPLACFRTGALPIHLGQL